MPSLNPSNSLSDSNVNDTENEPVEEITEEETTEEETVEEETADSGKKKTRKYRVDQGAHVTGKGHKRVHYTRGDIIESETDLAKLYPEKFSVVE